MAASTPKPAEEKPARPAKAAKAEKPAKAAPKPAEARPATAKRASKAPAPAKAPKAEAADMLKIRTLIDSVASATGAKKPDAKKSVEAVLAAIGAGLAAKSTLSLPPLGKLRVVKSNGSVMTLKLRLADAARAKGLALADEDEDS